MRIIDRIMAPLGRRIDESHPYEDARLPDGSRVNAVVPPISLVGPCLTIRKFFRTPITVEKLVEFGAITAEAIDFMKAAVMARLNIVISGGTGSGKTTFLNILSGFIPSRRAHHHHRKRRRAAVAPGARGDAGVAPAQYRGPRRGHHPEPGDQCPAHAPRPDRGRGDPRRSRAGHAAGHEHRPRWLDDHRPLQQRARHPVAHGNHDADGRAWTCPYAPSASRFHRPST